LFISSRSRWWRSWLVWNSLIQDIASRVYPTRALVWLELLLAWRH